MSSSKFTVESCTCPLFGRPKQFRPRLLPTCKDVILYCIEKRRIFGRISNGNREPKFSEIADSVATEILEFYKKCFIPHVSFERVLQLINKLHN